MNNIKQINPAVKVYLNNQFINFEQFKNIAEKLNNKNTFKSIKSAINLNNSDILTQSSKTKKSLKNAEIYNYVLYFIPEKKHGLKVNLCPLANNCKKVCLSESGYHKLENFAVNKGSLKYNRVYNKKLLRTWLYFANNELFMYLLDSNIKNLANKYNNNLVIRLNGTSDIIVNKFEFLYKKYNKINFVEYTKIYKNLEISKKYKNLTIVFSFDGINSNIDTSLKALKNGFGVAFASSYKMHSKIIELKNTKYPVINADIFDTRNIDRNYFNIPKNKGYLIALKFKEVINANKHEIINHPFIADNINIFK